MALGGFSTRPNRSSGPGRGRWWLLVGAGLTIVVLVISGALHARSQAPIRTESAQTWTDRVLPLIAQSTAEGTEINQVRASGLTMSGQTAVGELQTAAKDAASTLKRFRSLDPPGGVVSAAGLLQTALAVRAQAAKSLAAGFSAALSGTGTPTEETPTIVTAAQDMQVADHSYALFAEAMPKLGVTIPSSVWMANPALYGINSLNVFLTAMKAKTNTTAIHDMSVVAVSTSPTPLSVTDGVQMVEKTSTVSVDVVVANVGNQPQFDVAVTLTISPVKAGTTAVRQTTVNLAAGQAQALAFGGLQPGAARFTLRAQVAAVTGETDTANNAKTVTLQQVSS